MRTWIPDAQGPVGAAALAELVAQLAEPGFGATVLHFVRRIVPATSLSVYRTAVGATPVRFLGLSSRDPDTTADCWRAYVSGPHRHDRTLGQGDTDVPGGVALVSHITAAEVPAEHRSKVYDPHGMVERVSVLRRDDDDSVFAVNFYRHRDTGPFTDREIGDFGAVAPVLLALMRKHVQLTRGADGEASPHRRRLQALAPGMTARELDVCERLLQGMTQEGTAVDLGLSLSTVKTYRNRAFGRLGIHFRSQLFARLLEGGGH
ncbi:LuxR C-terminal-related transcriptional regulator [Aquabacterium sp. J223]|uniref:helix-turn-helix transcriptional regulator n=1 Tax=Aquabacterium sp. J223 TaxID=2898431 RepID=UPI0021AD9D67|nr:LuxR C-terminal-related transcriptional regulator [Aquabacterium sp. J223]UUX94523.1 LuxR C-terminal-related transcriptional regulator [Aquabacterium sp. J223]